MLMAVLGAALLHATWNALVKGGHDKQLSMAAVVLGHAPFGLVAIVLSPTPSVESVPWLLAGIAIHVAYQVLLLASYRIGDLTQVYPIARGTAPLLVAAVSVLFLGERLSPLELGAVATIALGIMSLALVRQADGLRNLRATGFALATGVAIAGYSLVDGIGARIAGTALGFYGWLALGNALCIAIMVAAGRPDLIRALPRDGKRFFVVGGAASFGAYALVMWAFTQAPIALVTALRETSIIFALIIGVLFLGEPLRLVKVVSTFVTLLGAVLLKVARP